MAQETYEVPFAKSFKTKDKSAKINNHTWTLSKACTYGVTSSNGVLQLGSGNKPMKEFSLTATDYKGIITKITVNAYAKDANSTLSISVGSVNFKGENAIPTELGDMVFTGKAQGDIVLSINASKQFYLKSITIEYTSSTGIATPTITPASKTFSESFTATISCTDAAAKIYYTLDGNTPDANSTPYTRGITIPEETTTLKAVAIKDSKASKVADAVYTYVAVTPEKPNASNIYTIWSEDWSKYKKDDKPTEGSNATYECKNGGSITKIYNEEIAGGTAPELLISKLEGALTINILDLKNFFGTLYFSLTSNADKINLSSATENITLGKFTKEGKKYTCAITIPQGTKGLNLKIENKIKNNIRVDDLSLFAKIGSFTITSARYGTYYTEDAFVMPEGVTGYTITEKDGESLTLNAAYPANEVVPAKTALLLKATETPATNKDFTYTIVNSDKVAPEGNLLHGSVEATKTQVEGATAYYKLAKGEEGIGFYWANENGTAFTNGANKAYLAITGKLSQMRGFSFESMTTGINNVVANTNNSKNAVIYDLNGRRINTLNAAKGVYIVNGKKVIVK